MEGKLGGQNQTNKKWALASVANVPFRVRRSAQYTYLHSYVPAGFFPINKVVWILIIKNSTSIPTAGRFLVSLLKI